MCWRNPRGGTSTSTYGIASPTPKSIPRATAQLGFHPQSTRRVISQNDGYQCICLPRRKEDDNTGTSIAAAGRAIIGSLAGMIGSGVRGIWRVKEIGRAHV